MATQVHSYPIVVNWQGGREGFGEIQAMNSGATLPIAVPPEFQGPGGATNPEELLSSAIAGCYSITLGIILSNRKLPVANIQVNVEGTVEQNGASFVYTSVAIKPTITLDAEATDAQLQQTHEFALKADHYCIITNAVREKVKVSVEPSVVKE